MDSAVISQRATRLGEELMLLWERTGDPWLCELAQIEGVDTGLRQELPARLNDQERLDWVSTALMHCYKNSGDSEVFALLFELNRASFLQAIQARLRRISGSVDAYDVLQEVFLNIYRYPHRFHADRADAFRSWGHRIVRNTLFRSVKGRSRVDRQVPFDDALAESVDSRSRSPQRIASESETAVLVDRAYLLYLNLYLLHFERLSERERRALAMVEVDALSYRVAADALGIRVENLKMVIFRGRRKILRGVTRSLQDLGTSFTPSS